MNDAVSIAIFAKAPVAGFAKTRLVPRIGAQAAADLQRRLIAHTVDVALAAKLGSLSIWCTPNCEHEVFTSLTATRSIKLFAQSGDDLGQRMLNAFAALTPGGPALIIGSDCPMLEPSHLRDCAGRLHRGADVVLLPTEDGGYALVGAAKPWPALFLNMPWGTDHVVAETRQRARELGLQVAESAVVWDIDTPADYERALASGLFDQR